jgi:hypothetical protein
MSQFVVLSNEKHRQFKLKKNASLAYAATQQAIPIEAVEVAKAAINFPIFFTKNQHDEMTLSAIAGLNSGESLFMKEGVWDASYVPACLQTYPFYLIQSPDNEKEFTVGIQEDNPSFSTTEGDPLYDGEGKPTPQLERVGSVLNRHLDNVRATVLMVDRLKGLDLFKPIDILLQFQDNTARRINGLYSIDEDKLNQLPADELVKLNQDGVLFVMHALIVSNYQINNLVRRYNQGEVSNKIVNITIELNEVTA